MDIETTGTKLKRELGLEQFRYVRISRAVISSYRILFVFYDSFRVDMPISFFRIKKHPAIAQILSGTNLEHGDHHKTLMTPPLDIISYNGNILGSLIIPVDLCGDRFVGKGRELSIKFESINRENIIPSFIVESINLEALVNLLEDAPTGEGFTIKDLIANGESDRNKKFYKLRFDDGNPGSFLKNVTFNKEQKTLLLTFKTNITYDRTAQVTNKDSTFRTANYYTTYIQFENVDYHLASPEEFLQLSKGDQVKFLQSMIKTATIRVHSNDMSYYWQGGWENADKLGWALVPFTGTAGKGIWSRKHMGEFPAIYVTKHIVELLKIVPFLAPQIAQLIRKRYGHETD